MNPPSSARRVCLVGAGYISHIHAEALRELSIPIAAVVDPNKAAREKLAAAWNIPGLFGSIEEALASGSFDRAHILVPPDIHENAALAMAEKNIAVLVEKPMTTTVAACERLMNAAREPSRLGVNQNFVYHPAFVRLRNALDACALGKLRYLDVVFHAPLRQLAARQFGHWMFREPRNIFLEQAVHPLSVIAAVCGTIERIEAIGGQAVEIAPDLPFCGSFTVALAGQKAPASFRFGVGENFPVWHVTAHCDDGVLTADILANRFWTIRRTRWLEAVDDFVSGQMSALAMVRDSWKNMIDYGLATTKLAGRKDGFYRSMVGSIRAFHDGVDRNTPALTDGAFGKHMIEICDRIAGQVLPASIIAPRARSAQSSWTPDIAVLGGTGFIGTALVARLRKAGLKVAVMARGIDNLPAVFGEDGVRLHRGSIGSAADVGAAIGDAPCVINLAHGGGGESYEDIRKAMVGGAEIVANACRGKRLIHVGSIASLYLGPQNEVVTGATPPDPRKEQRASYARAKAECDLMLMKMNREDGLAVSIFRPGLVVGPGTSPFHSGLGFYNNDQYCIGWNEGDNPLPFVLVSDVAEALFRACGSRGVDGKTYNLVGDFRPNAREYTAELARVTSRPLKFHGKSVYGLYSNEFAKWLVKLAARRKSPPPYLRDLLSRGLKATFDCSDAKRDLAWAPVSNAAIFYAEAFRDCVAD